MRWPNDALDLRKKTVHTTYREALLRNVSNRDSGNRNPVLGCVAVKKITKIPTHKIRAESVYCYIRRYSERGTVIKYFQIGNPN